MRILFVTNNYTPYAGGVVSSINATVQELQKQGHKILLVAPNFLGANHDDPKWIQRVPSLLRFRYKNNCMAVPWRAAYYLKRIIIEFKPDIIHVHHPFLLGPIAQRIAKKMGIKTVFTYHTIYEGYVHYVPLPQFVLKPIVKKMVLNFCKKVDQIIVPSSAIKVYLAGQDIFHTNLIPSGLKEQFARQPFIKKIMDKPYQLLYVGRFAREKNIPALLDVIKKLPNAFYLTLVGYGPYTDFLKKYACENGMLSSERVRFIVDPKQKRLLDLYRKADLFLFASHTDTQGLVLAEAMAFSTPVIALDGPGQRDIITGKNGFIVADIDGMVKKIVLIAGYSDEYEDLQKNAWKSSRAYKVTPLVQRMLAVYFLLVAEERS